MARAGQGRVRDRGGSRRGEDPWQLNEIVRRRRLREQARRTPAVNLAEGIALSELMSTFRGAARR